MIEPSNLPSLLRYEPETGRLFWLRRPREMFANDRAFAAWNARYANREAFIANTRGYKSGSIGDRMMLAHRVIWALVHGQWPNTGIDHINGDRSDNRLANLRMADQSQNMRNQAPRSGGSSAFKGVKLSSRGKWIAQITLQYRTHHVGSFASEADAARAYDAAAMKLHGEFARLNFPQGVAP